MSRIVSLAILWAACGAAANDLSILPVGTAPPPVPAPHFPTRMHAVVWRNWDLVPAERIARTLGATPEQVQNVAASMGLPANRPIAPKYAAHAYKSVLRRNWHLLPYEQLLTLLDMPADELAVHLQEDDFLFLKLGGSKPACAPVVYAEPDAVASARAAEIAEVVRRRFGAAIHEPGEDRFAFIETFAEPPKALRPFVAEKPAGPRFLYSYVAPFGDPLLDPATDPYPDGLLAQYAANGVNGVWMHVVLRQLAPGGDDFPEFGEGHARRLENLRRLVARCRTHGIDVYLYLNEPRAMPHAFFERRPGLAGVKEAELTALCTSDPRTLRWMTAALTHVFTAVPELGGVFTITASENLTNCASHGHKDQCPRCRNRAAAEIIGEVNAAIERGVHAAVPTAKVMAWDWGWNGHRDGAAEIAALPANVGLLSVSEWATPFERGGVKGTVGEYSMSVVGPGPRAKRHWSLAKARGLQAIAKVQVNNTWELSAIPSLPVLDLVAEHAHRLAAEDVDGLMLSWSLGGSPSPNLDVACTLASDPDADPDAVLTAVAERTYGKSAAPEVRQAWTAFSDAFREFPYGGAVLYRGPQQFGPANPLYAEPTGRGSTMIGFPYDDLDGWRGPYPRQTFADQFEKLVRGWEVGLHHFEAAAGTKSAIRPAFDPTFGDPRADADLGLARAAHAHFASTANQARFVILRDRLRADPSDAAARRDLLAVIDAEAELARTLYDLTKSDGRIGFEASNGYYYTPLDLVEKAVNCEHVRSRFAGEGR